MADSRMGVSSVMWPWMASPLMRMALLGTPLGTMAQLQVPPRQEETAEEAEEETEVLMDEEEPQRVRPAKRRRVQAQPAEGERRKHVLLSWGRLLRVNLEASTVGRQLRDAENEDEEETTLRYSLFAKATNTLVTRLSPLVAYLEWA